MNDREFKADIWSKTAAEWTAENPYLAKNDLGVESDTGKTKVGVGQRWANTSYLPSAAGILEPPNDGNTYGRQSGQWVDLEQATSLQFRQGTDAERLAMSPVPASGEPIYTTDTKRLFIGDGTAVGGRSVLMGDSSSYIVCQPGDDIQAKYAAAKLLTPNGAALSATNRATLLVMPGGYPVYASANALGNVSNIGLFMDADYVDVIGVGSQMWKASFTLVNAGGSPVVGIAAQDATLCGVGANIFPGSGGANRLIINCVASIVYAPNTMPQTENIAVEYGGRIVGCHATSSLVGSPSGYPGVFTGEVLYCRSDFSVFRHTLFQGTLSHCIFPGFTSGFNSFRVLQGRIAYCSFPNITTANLPGRSTDGGTLRGGFTGTCTISQASPAVVTKTSHGLRSGVRIRFSTTGTLPSGLDANTTYYVRYIDDNSFSVATTVGGTLINTTTAGSGDHSIVIPPGVEGGRYSYCTTSDGEYTTP